MTTYTEKRRHPRFLAEQVIEMSYNREQFLRVKEIDISAGGVMLATEDPVEIGNSVYLILSLKVQGKEQRIEANGLIIHTHEKNGLNYFGVQFAPFAEAESKKIFEEYLSKLKK